MALKKQGLARSSYSAPVIYDGDGANYTLHAIKARYERKAAYLAALGVRPTGDGLYYEKAAAAVGDLL